eukprot:jgi/Astpho2/2749/e_gw1.00050.142.1_t
MGTLEQLQKLEGHTDRVWNVEWSPDGDWHTLATCSGDMTVRIWQQQGGQGPWRCTAFLEETHHRTIRSCSWSPDGQYLATASFDATTAIWRRQGPEWEQVALLEGHESEVKGVAWSPTGTLLATCSRDKSVWIWESLPGNEYECVDVKQGHTQDVKMVAWHPSGELLVSASYDDTVKLWVDSGDDWECVQTLSGSGVGHTSTVWGVAFSADGGRLVTCSDDLSLKFWSCQLGPGRPRCKLLTTVTGLHERTIFSVHWSSAGPVATGSSDNGLRIFEEVQSVDSDAASLDPSSSQQPCFRMSVHKEQAHDFDVNCVRWHPKDPLLLASAGDDNSVKLWRYMLAAAEMNGLHNSSQTVTR